MVSLDSPAGLAQALVKLASARRWPLARAAARTALFAILVFLTQLGELRHEAID